MICLPLETGRASNLRVPMSDAKEMLTGILASKTYKFQKQPKPMGPAARTVGIIRNIGVPGTVTPSEGVVSRIMENGGGLRMEQEHFNV